MIAHCYKFISGYGSAKITKIGVKTCQSYWQKFTDMLGHSVLESAAMGRFANIFPRGGTIKNQLPRHDPHLCSPLHFPSRHEL